MIRSCLSLGLALLAFVALVKHDAYAFPIFLTGSVILLAGIGRKGGES